MRTAHAESTGVDASVGSSPIAQRVRELHANKPVVRRRNEAISSSAARISKRRADTAASGAKDSRGAQPVKKAGETQTSSGKKPGESNVARSSLVMFLGTLMSRVLGLVRSPILLGAIVGLNTPAADSFAVANKIPNLIYMIVVGGLVNAVLVPSIVRATKESDDGGASFLNKLLTLTIVFLGGITLLLTLGAPMVVRLFASTMDSQWYTLTVAFAFWCLPQIFFYGLYTVLGQILNARENFGPYMWAPVVNNIIAVVGFVGILMVFGGADSSEHMAGQWTAIRVAALGGVSTVGIAAQALVLVIPLRKLGISFRPDFSWRGSGLGDAGRASWWMLLMMVTGLIPTMLVSNVAAGARARAEELHIPTYLVGGNATYDNAYALYSLPTSLIVVSIATAMFTRLSKAAVDGDLAKMRRDTSKTLRVVSTLMVLSSTLIITLAVPLTRIVAFTVNPQETVVLAQVLIAMSLGLVGVGAVTVLDRVYYAFEDTRGAFWINLPFQALGLLGYVACGLINPRWTVIGVGIVMSSANILAFITMVTVLSRRMNGLDEARLLRSHVKLAGIGSATIMVGWVLQGFVGPIFTPMSLTQAVVRCLVLGPIVVVIFFAAMKLLRMEELGDLAGPFAGLMRKFGIGNRVSSRGVKASHPMKDARVSPAPMREMPDTRFTGGRRASGASTRVASAYRPGFPPSQAHSRAKVDGHSDEGAGFKNPEER